MNYIDALNKRYSVKKFDTEKKVTEETLNRILEAGRLSASSLGLQPYRVLVISSPSKKEDLASAFYNPSQTSTCSHLLVIISKKELEKNYVDSYFNLISKERQAPLEALQPFRNSVEGYINRHNSETLPYWNEKQAYILLSNFIFSAALEGVDTCPMEGFDAHKVTEILNIDASKEIPTVCLALGYRAHDDLFQHGKKVRKPSEDLFQYIK
ncbi:NAD(P)H-dependent oxidoreductase [Riemerella anatipestifer]|uniref:NAD(P)H-dependent oxidoreductase n=1 Tax=Riemerella anatipestifer TaxID=34085 RepID=UPI0028571142|nr:NAD(P)H-dependent oxidoreductase [Riemerella anatipestifer]MDR7694749.1 NAD(P)H-dependent oxidoreductase [Riemerella anatipestifer]MDR7794851.1 NAD(P)H-dependent oxidoreductase [Riemerella anatipestifer]